MTEVHRDLAVRMLERAVYIQDLARFAASRSATDILGNVGGCSWYTDGASWLQHNPGSVEIITITWGTVRRATAGETEAKRRRGDKLPDGPDDGNERTVVAKVTRSAAALLIRQVLDSDPALVEHLAEAGRVWGIYCHSLTYDPTGRNRESKAQQALYRAGHTALQDAHRAFWACAALEPEVPAQVEQLDMFGDVA